MLRSNFITYAWWPSKVFECELALLMFDIKLASFHTLHAPSQEVVLCENSGLMGISFENTPFTFNPRHVWCARARATAAKRCELQETFGRTTVPSAPIKHWGSEP